MQNRNNNIEERLQIINDYIQRTMDALNATRQVVQGLSATAGYPSFVSPAGLGHTSFVPQFIQTPFGVVAVNSPISAAQIPQVAGQFAGQFAPVGFGYGYGLQHTGLVPQIQAWPMNVSSLGVSPLGVPSLGVPSLGVPSVGVNYNYGWPTGLNHSSFVPQMAQWGVPVSVAAQWPVNANVVQHGVPNVAL